MRAGDHESRQGAGPRKLRPSCRDGHCSFFWPSRQRSRANRPAPDIPFIIEDARNDRRGDRPANQAATVSTSSRRGPPLAGFLDMAGITAAGINGEPRRAPTLRSATTVTLVSSPPGISVEPMSAEKRLALGIPIDLNRSSFEDLVLVPGIGEKTAEKIVEERGHQRDVRQARGAHAGQGDQGKTPRKAPEISLHRVLSLRYGFATFRYLFPSSLFPVCRRVLP